VTSFINDTILHTVVNCNYEISGKCIFRNVKSGGLGVIQFVPKSPQVALLPRLFRCDFKLWHHDRSQVRIVDHILRVKCIIGGRQVARLRLLNDCRY